ncbi:hypothetical protein CJF32_00007309 [Rutstroemia sp. NJR-2017a WRK4]|nr:hypothetical protein CJF32_00007309 [Rutstroemia sp. NJR-2017a WRK4]
MLLSQELTLPCGLRLPNRLSKGAMAEAMAPTHQLDEKFLKAYGQWADGGWGMIITGNVQVSSKYLGSAGDVTTLQHTSASPSDADKEIWRTWAATCQRGGAATVVQLCHAGRQSPLGAGDRGFFDKTVAPSAVPMNFGPSWLERAAVKLVFGTPRELTIEEISGKDGVIDQFVSGAKQCFEAGFKGVELHGAHGYLLAQFLSPLSNQRGANDPYGGTPAKRAAIVVEIIHKIREQTSKEFCIGIKMNSVDASGNEFLDDTLEQIRLIVEAGIDFIEISGGNYENPRMMQESNTTDAIPQKDSKPANSRESFFLQFAQTVREQFPSVVLMVTGGFRTRTGMEAALQSGACDLIGIARPSAVLPKLPKEIILNTEIPDEEATITLAPLKVPLLIKYVPVKQVGAGYQSKYYAGQIQRMAKGLLPVNTRI